MREFQIFLGPSNDFELLAISNIDRILIALINTTSVLHTLGYWLLRAFWLLRLLFTISGEDNHVTAIRQFGLLKITTAERQQKSKKENDKKFSSTHSENCIHVTI